MGAQPAVAVESEVKVILLAECGHTGVAECTGEPRGLMFYCRRCSAFAAMTDSVMEPDGLAEWV